VDHALLQQSMLVKLKSPSPSDLRFLQTWMKTPSMGNVYLLGPDSDIWEKPDQFDLVTLHAQENGDLISRFLTDVLIHWYHRLFGWHFKVCYPISFRVYVLNFSPHSVLAWLNTRVIQCITPKQAFYASVRSLLQSLLPFY
jgi:hypothetical protein